MAQNMRFIRKNGRVIPIRTDKGIDLRSKAGPKASRRDISVAYKEAEAHTRLSTGTKLKRSAFMAVGGGFFGGLFGATAGLAVGAAALGAAALSRGKLKISADFLGKAVGSGLLGGATGGAIALGTNANSHVVRKTQFNKALGKRLRMKGTTG